MRSLAGIERLTGLTSVHLYAAGDFSPLGALPKLEKLFLFSPKDEVHAQSALLDGLRGRGVEVTIEAFATRLPAPEVPRR